jgi:hypothetical protein
MRLTQCLRAFAACLTDEVNITAIVGMTHQNRPKSAVFTSVATVGVGHCFQASNPPIGFG